MAHEKIRWYCIDDDYMKIVEYLCRLCVYIMWESNLVCTY